MVRLGGVIPFLDPIEDTISPPRQTKRRAERFGLFTNLLPFSHLSELLDARIDDRTCLEQPVPFPRTIFFRDSRSDLGILGFGKVHRDRNANLGTESWTADLERARDLSSELPKERPDPRLCRRDRSRPEEEDVGSGSPQMRVGPFVRLRMSGVPETLVVVAVDRFPG